MVRWLGADGRREDGEGAPLLEFRHTVGCSVGISSWQAESKEHFIVYKVTLLHEADRWCVVAHDS